MRHVILHGQLGKRFGRHHWFDVATPAEAVRALRANFPDFERYLVRTAGLVYRVMVGRDVVPDARGLRAPSSRREPIRIIPVVAGAKRGGLLQVFLGVVLIVVGVYTENPQLIGIGVSLVVGGVVQMLTPIPRAPGPEESPENMPSNVFNGPVNTTAQGHPVPMGYGRMIIGSAVISGGIALEGQA
jgi:predicted phage tail protein